MDRLAYLARRLLLVIPTFIGITIVCFTLTRFLPGGPVEMRMMRMKGMAAQGAAGEGAGASAAGAAHIGEEYRKQLEAQFGFDKPIYRQYYDWLVVNRMGMKLPSYDYPNKTAWQLIKSRIPISIWFGLASFLLTYLICIPLGIAKALRHRQAFDAVSSFVVFVSYAIPSFAFAMMLKMFLCGTVDGLWNVFPLGGVSSDFDVDPSFWTWFADRAWHMVLPICCYVAGSFAMLTLLMKNSLLDQIASDYVRTVIAKGGTRMRAIWLHAFRNALIPVATGLGSMIGLLFAGSIIIETIFEIPGMGRLSWDALIGRDYAVFLALLALTASFQLVGNLISDVLYMVIDPRIDFSKK
ncbi:MAG: ABC transporter permease subunit [Lentisphaerae bacterium]|jgi:microcin C transport system permease protein|nr:ABC transporter permease subunit [Lentisphaerota bacterium]